MSGPVAYLTIDDAPSSSMGEKIGYLKRAGIPAIFFCVGSDVEERSRVVVEAVEQGSVIGNHSYSHPRFSEISLGDAKAEIRKTEEVIARIYGEANVERPAKLFRFPYGDTGGENAPELQAYLRERGYTKPAFEGITYDWYEEHGHRGRVDWFWTFDAKEYELDALDALLERIDGGEAWDSEGLTGSESDDIVLIHDHEDTGEEFESILDHMRDRGVRFKLPRLGA